MPGNPISPEESRKRMLKALRAELSPEQRNIGEWAVGLARTSRKGRWERLLKDLSPEERKKLGY